MIGVDRRAGRLGRPDAIATASLTALVALAGLGGCAAHPTGPSSAASVAATRPPPALVARRSAAASVTADPRRSLNPVTSPYPRGRAGVPAGGVPAAGTRTSPDPDVVTRAALRVLFGSDTVLDTEPMDAERRALPWLGGTFAAAVRAAAITAAPGATWNTWAAHRAHLEVTVAPGYDDGAPPDTPNTAHRQWLITQTPVGAGADTGADSPTRPWTGTPVLTVVYTTTTRTGGRWAVTTLKEAP